MVKGWPYSKLHSYKNHILYRQPFIEVVGTNMFKMQKYEVKDFSGAKRQERNVRFNDVENDQKSLCPPKGAYVPEGLMTSCSWDYMTFTPSVRSYTMHLCLLHPSLCHHFLLLLYLQSHSTHNAVGTVHAHTNINTIYGYYSRRSPPVTHSHSCVNINKLAIKMNYKRGSVITVKLQFILFIIDDGFR